VSATEAARNFSDLLNRVRYRGESFVIERNGEAVGELRPTAPPGLTGADLLRLMASLPRVDEEYLASVEDVARTQPIVPDSPWDR
jgi:antitoxin (DNA-binding transcriptional repressor) of toxin-antitoxin stability system